eukprot:CAMPEP_0115851364 /NCGR_PEP_ID=MMETSP0287-20121206/12444_1 /TAXON_ID=412157 /ORGANISM="Chrysochromulina rotalis, Strain UIO044" /LENGTH=130 /DNA_ID=CAMNT_0003305395 /DNA_START=278 /DNA_END=670 /DNA_ORIENTATION=+
MQSTRPEERCCYLRVQPPGLDPAVFEIEAACALVGSQRMDTGMGITLCQNILGRREKRGRHAIAHLIWCNEELSHLRQARSHSSLNRCKACYGIVGSHGKNMLTSGQVLWSQLNEVGKLTIIKKTRVDLS